MAAILCKLFSFSHVPISFTNPVNKMVLHKWYRTDPRLIQDIIFSEVRKVQTKREENSHQPSKLLAVWRTAPVKNRPHWEKKAMEELGLDPLDFKPVIVKNTPKICKLLSVVNHLVRVKPVTFPFGEPDRDGDFSGTYLNRKGEFIVHQKLKVEPQRLLDDPYHEDRKMDKISIEKRERWKWLYYVH